MKSQERFATSSQGLEAYIVFYLRDLGMQTIMSELISPHDYEKESSLIGSNPIREMAFLVI